MEIINNQLSISRSLSKEDLKTMRKTTKKFVIKKTKDFVIREKNANMATELPKSITLLFIQKTELKKGIGNSNTKYSGLALSSVAREALLKAKEKHLL